MSPIIALVLRPLYCIILSVFTVLVVHPFYAQQTIADNHVSFSTLPNGTTLKVTTAISDRRTLEAIETAQRIDFATLALGASIESFSSRLDDPRQCNVCANVHDVIGGTFSEYFSGEVGQFIFGMGDSDQYLVIDLGQLRRINQVGAYFSELTSDREVFDFFEALVSEDGKTFTSVGIVGIKGTPDNLDYTLDSPIFFTFDRLINVRFVRYNFGKCSPDWGGGSRVFEVFAVGPEDCTNGLDDDGDGFVDCTDMDCWSDEDNDGFLALPCGLDCDDNNPAIYPGPSEICGDGIDNNCDGLVDEGCGGR